VLKIVLSFVGGLVIPLLLAIIVLFMRLLTRSFQSRKKKSVENSMGFLLYTTLASQNYSI